MISIPKSDEYPRSIDGIQNTVRDLWMGRALLAVILLLELIVFYPAVHNDFSIVDDFICLAQARRLGLSPGALIEPYFGHVMPPFRLLIGVEYLVFGVRPAGYFAVCILMHMANTVLVSLFLERLTGSSRMGLIGALAFGISSAHWQPVLNLLASNSSMAAIFYLGSALCFMNHLRDSRWIWLIPALFFQAGAFFSISYGLEAPLLFYLLYLVYEARLPFKQRILRGSRYLLIFGAGSLLCLGARFWILSSQPAPQPSDAPGSSMERMISAIPTASVYFLGGIYEGYLKSYTGACLLNADDGLPESIDGPWFVDPDGGMPRTPSGPALLNPHLDPAWESETSENSATATWQALWIGVVLLVGFILVDWKNESFRARLSALLCLLAWALVLYLLPVVARILIGYDNIATGRFIPSYELFVISSRYRYVPAIPAVGVFAILAAHLRLPGMVFPGSWNSVLTSGLLGLVVLGSGIDLRRKIEAVRDLSRDFSKVRERLVDDVTDRLTKDPGPLPILSGPFYKKFVTWFLLGSGDILELYLPEQLQKRIVRTGWDGKPIGESSTRSAPRDSFVVGEDGRLQRAAPLKLPRKPPNASQPSR